MGLMDEIKAENAPSRICAVEGVLSSLDKQEAAELVEALEDAGVAATAISRVLKRREITVSQKQIQRHRRRECGCYA